jgi:hypothetical protein
MEFQMTLHQDPQLFRESIEAAAQRLRLRPVFVEKDYWVTYVLRNLSLSSYRDTVVFKGGTSLSKAYECIDRFSEDIDLAILSPQDYTGNQLRNRLKDVSDALAPGLVILNGHPSEKKQGRMRATALGYPKAIQGDYGVMKDFVLLEINCFTDPVPYLALPISCYIAKFFQQIGEQQLITEHNLEPVTISVLSLQRTFFEKMLSLNRLSYEGNDKLLEKIRHFYDLHQVYHLPSQTTPILHPDHYPILQNARQNDLDNTVMRGAWIGERIQDSPLFTNLEAIWQMMSPSYQTQLGQLVWTGRLPPPEAVLAVLQKARTFAIAFDAAHPPQSIT